MEINFPLLDNNENSVMAEYPENAKGFGLADFTDNIGKQWLFVVMLNNISPSNSLFHEGNNPGKQYFSVGWVPQ